MSGRLASAGLRWRLAGWFTLVTLLSTAIVFIAVYRGTGAQVRGQIDRELAGDSAELAHNLTTARAPTPHQLAAVANAYIRGQPFGASSTLLFALVTGAGTSTNQPEFFRSGQPDEEESAVEQGRENQLSAHLLSAPDGYRTLALPDVGDLRLLKRTLLLPRGLRVTVGAGEPLAPVRVAQRGVARTFLLAGVLALATALLASYLVGTRVSRPLRRMAAVATRVDAGDLHPRIRDVGRQGGEVKVLADAFNHMLDRLTAAFAGQREFVADASHELRTPLTVIRGQLEVLAAQPDPSREEVRRVEALVRAEIARMSRLVDDLLLLAKSEQTEFLREEPINLPQLVNELWDGTTLTASRRFELSEVPDGTLRADPDRLAQALRNLLANAIDHTAQGSGLVRLGGQALPGARVQLVVEDDGPGVPVDERERVFDRFHRTDAARDRASGGAGLGLAIVRAVAVAHGGSVSAGVSPEGGARFVLELPGFSARADTPRVTALAAHADPPVTHAGQGAH